MHSHIHDLNETRRLHKGKGCGLLMKDSQNSSILTFLDLFERAKNSKLQTPVEASIRYNTVTKIHIKFNILSSIYL